MSNSIQSSTHNIVNEFTHHFARTLYNYQLDKSIDHRTFRDISKGHSLDLNVPAYRNINQTINGTHIMNKQNTPIKPVTKKAIEDKSYKATMDAVNEIMQSINKK